MLVVALCAALLIGRSAVSGCSNKDAAAKVNGEVDHDVGAQQQLDQLKKQYPQMFTGADGEGRLLDFKQRLLDNLINQKLVEQAAKSKGITVSDADVQKQIDQLKAGFKDQAQFDAGAQECGHDRRRAQDADPNQLVTQKLVESLAADTRRSRDAEIQAYYDKNKAQFFQKAGQARAATSSSSRRTRRPPRRCSRRSRPAATSRRWPRSTRSTRPPRPRAATSVGRRRPTCRSSRPRSTS